MGQGWICTGGQIDDVLGETCTARILKNVSGSNLDIQDVDVDGVLGLCWLMASLLCPLSNVNCSDVASNISQVAAVLLIIWL